MKFPVYLLLALQFLITHNLMGLFPEIDYYDLAADLAFASWDNYPVGGAPNIRCDASMAADLMRGVKDKNFWIMEQTAGAPGWGAFGRNPRPGEIRNVAYQQLAHGCDGQIWFRWRTCTVGREQYWHGLLGHDGQPLRRYEEAKQTAAEYHKLAEVLDGTTVKAEVAMVYDYTSLWATRIQPGFKGNDYHADLRRYYQALFRAGINVDMI
ncbi:MAG: beta-galactosidase, partial [Planctomycetes bacterium]|nr:beta-galactosidase [Planctomycetota bacterium]